LHVQSRALEAGADSNNTKQPRIIAGPAINLGQQRLTELTKMDCRAGSPRLHPWEVEPHSGRSPDRDTPTGHVGPPPNSHHARGLMLRDAAVRDPAGNRLRIEQS